MMPSTRAVTHSFARATTHGTLVDVVRIVRPRAPTVGAGHLTATREQQRRVECSNSRASNSPVCRRRMFSWSRGTLHAVVLPRGSAPARVMSQLHTHGCVPHYTRTRTSGPRWGRACRR